MASYTISTLFAAFILHSKIYVYSFNGNNKVGCRCSELGRYDILVYNRIPRICVKTHPVNKQKGRRGTLLQYYCIGTVRRGSLSLHGRIHNNLIMQFFSAVLLANVARDYIKRWRSTARILLNIVQMCKIVLSMLLFMLQMMFNEIIVKR